MFDVDNGVKQGGILSPLLFCVYFDVLIDRLTQSGYGCYIGLVFLAVFVYADDIVLLAPTATAMRHLLSVSDIFATDFDVSFNAQKTKCIPGCWPIPTRVHHLARLQFQRERLEQRFQSYFGRVNTIPIFF